MKKFRVIAVMLAMALSMVAAQSNTTPQTPQAGVVYGIWTGGSAKDVAQDAVIGGLVGGAIGALAGGLLTLPAGGEGALPGAVIGGAIGGL